MINYIYNRSAKFTCSLILLFLLTGCVAPSTFLLQHANTFDFERIELPGKAFTHISFQKKARKNKRLHVYIEGDGRPWIQRVFPATDPSPRASIMFRLMNMDNQNSLYLGRPCYLGQAHSPPCKTLHWTHQRHSEEIVLSMATALKHFLQNNPTNELVFIGHSGGGALAMLLARHFPKTSAIVTLGGNLDIDAWVQHHGYTPLRGSLNPATLPPYPPTVLQIHVGGEKDKTIPPELIKTALANQPHSEFILLEGATHTCCWKRIWPKILKRLDEKS